MNLFALLFAWLDSLDVRPDTRASYLTSTHNFLTDLRVPLSSLTERDIRAWRDSHDNPATANLRLVAVRSFLAWLVKHGHLERSPAADVDSVGGGDRTHKRSPLTDAEVIDLLATCDVTRPIGARDHAMICLMTYSGMRTIEVHRADVDSIDTRLNKAVIWVHRKRKSAAGDYLYLAQQPERSVRRWLAMRDSKLTALFTSLSNRNYGERMSRDRIRHVIKARFKLANIVDPRKTTHSLRHTALTAARRAGGTMRQIQGMAGHSDPATTQIYLDADERDSDPVELKVRYGEG